MKRDQVSDCTLPALDAPHYQAIASACVRAFSIPRRHFPIIELLELVLFAAIPRRDVKPLAKTLLAKFGSFAKSSLPPARDCRSTSATAQSRSSRSSKPRRSGFRARC